MLITMMLTAGLILLLFTCLSLIFFLRQRQQALAHQQHIEVRLQDEIEQLKKQCQSALEDEITGLPSWTLFEDRLRHALGECERFQMTAAVLLIEFNDFDMISEMLGGAVSHVFLKEAGMRMRQILRKVDTISRYKNASFAVIATQLTKPEAAAIVAQRILQVLASPFYINNHELYVNASVGIAIYPTDGTEATSLLYAAQSAAITASQNGNHIYYFYKAETQQDSQREVMIHMNIMREKIYHELVIYYQPIVNFKNQSVSCMEAMLNWEHADIGRVLADELTHHIEKQRKANTFTEWLLKAACRQFVHWREFGFSPALLGLQISIRQLESTPFVYHLSQIMQETGFKPEWLLLELKDTHIDLSFDVLEKAFNMLDYMGVKLAMTRMGSSAFSFHYLRRLNITYIMLDAHLIEDIETNPKTTALVRGMSEFTERQACELVACGVETEKQATILNESGCYLMQGLFVGEAVQDSEVKEKMAP